MSRRSGEKFTLHLIPPPHSPLFNYELLITNCELFAILLFTIISTIMKRFALVLASIIISACSNVPSPATPAVPTHSSTELPVTETKTKVVAPIAEYGKRNSLKLFGNYIQDRFVGYHVGDDIEYTDTEDTIPVYAISVGTVEYKNWVAGYGGLIRVKHTINDKTIRALYGHVALDSSSLQVGDTVAAGQFIANLGKGNSTETDGERKHLHFGLYEGDIIRINGYENKQGSVGNWINPKQFLLDQGADLN